MKIYAVLFTLVVLLSATTWAQAPSAAEILKKCDQIRMPEGDATFQVKIEDYAGPRLLNSSIYSAQMRGNEAALIETLAPPLKKGRKLLMLKDNLWFYTQSIRRPQRIGVADRLTGEVANGDIARTNYTGDYNPRLIDSVTINNKKAYHLELLGNRKEVTYQKLEVWIEEGTFFPLKTNFFTMGGKLLKVGEYSEFKKINGATRPLKMTIADAVNTKKRSVLTYSKIKAAKLNSAIFNVESMAQ